MRRMWIYGVAAALVIGCKSAERRGSDAGCDEGELDGRAAAMSDRAACAEPAPVPTGCNQRSGGTFRRDKYRDAFGDAFAICYEAAYLDQWTYAEWAAECDGDTAELRDTGVVMGFD